MGSLDALSWGEFAAEVASILEASPDAIGTEARLVEDLGFDSLSLTELVVFLSDKHEMFADAEALDDRVWEDVTAGDLYAEYLAATANDQSTGTATP